MYWASQLLRLDKVNTQTMKLLDRDLSSEFLKTLGWFLLILSFIFFVDTFLGLLEDIAKAENSVISWALLYYVYRLPGFFVETAVIAVATSILWVITKKARSMELMAYMAGGISPVRIAMPLLIISAIISAGVFSINEFVRVEADERAQWVHNIHIKQKNPDRLYSSENIHRRGGENRFYFIDQFNSVTQTMTNATIIDLDPKTYLPRTILRVGTARLLSPEESAQKPSETSSPANPENTSAWELRSGSIRTFDESNNLEHLDTFDLADSRNLGISLDAGLDSWLSSSSKPEDMSFQDLRRFISLSEQQNKPVNVLKLELYNKLALPLAVLLVAMVICSHVLRPGSSGIVAGFGLGLLWIAGFYILFLFVQRFETLAHEMPPFLLSMIPGIIYGVIGVVTLIRRHSRI